MRTINNVRYYLACDRKILPDLIYKSKVLQCSHSWNIQQYRSQHLKTSMGLIDNQRKWIDQVQERITWLNQRYESIVGISDIRQMQNQVLNAEAEFLETTAMRKECQDKIDSLKTRIKELWDKLESTPRSSENYIDLRTSEHKLMREQMLLDVQLKQLKDKEQSSFDSLSRLLRRSHELERLQQERSKSLQIISVGLTLAGSLVALVAQRSRNQTSQMKKFDAANESRFSDLKMMIGDFCESSKSRDSSISSALDAINRSLGRLEVVLSKSIRSPSDSKECLILKEPDESLNTSGLYVTGVLLLAVVGYLFFR